MIKELFTSRTTLLAGSELLIVRYNLRHDEHIAVCGSTETRHHKKGCSRIFFVT